MSRRLLVIAIALGVTAITSSNRLAATPIIKQLVPSTGPGGQYVIAVLSDGYTAANSVAFDNDASLLIVSDLFMDPFYQARQTKFTVKTIFDAWPSTDPAHPPLTPESNYGFKVESGVTDCDISWLDGTAAAVERVASTVAPDHILVIANNRMTRGCSAQNWTYVPAGAFGSFVIQHEFGHLVAGLFDEYVLHAGDDPDAPIDRLNCSTKQRPAVPYWMSQFPSSTNAAGCDAFSSHIVHPFGACLMNLHQAFCAVCRWQMDRALEPAPPPMPPTNLKIVPAAFGFQPAPPGSADQSVRVLLRVDRRNGRATVEAANDVAGPIIAQYRRFGAYGYEVTEQGRTVATAAIRGNPFETRSYSRGNRHETSRGDVGFVTVIIPHATKANLRARNLEITIYQFDDESGQADLTPQELARLKQAGRMRPVVRVAASDLAKVMQ